MKYQTFIDINEIVLPIMSSLHTKEIFPIFGLQRPVCLFVCLSVPVSLYVCGLLIFFGGLSILWTVCPLFYCFVVYCFPLGFFLPFEGCFYALSGPLLFSSPYPCFSCYLIFYFLINSFFPVLFLSRIISFLNIQGYKKLKR